MRIIGGSDYYDGCLAYGRDETILFKRDGGRRLSNDATHEDLGVLRREMGFDVRSVESGKRAPRGRMTFAYIRRRNQEISLRNGRVVLQPMHVVLCGVLHSGVVASMTPRGQGSREVTRIWKAEALVEYCTRHDMAIHDVDTRMTKDTRTDARGIRYEVDVRMDSLVDYFSAVPIRQTRAGRMIGERITIITKDPEPIDFSEAARETPWIVDGTNLGAMGFAKAMDPNSAHQEIAMWNGGVLGSEGPGIVEITDDRIKAEKHGFHHPTSFRRAKAGG